MAQNKKKKRTKAQKKESRIARAKNWLPQYQGTEVVRVYQNKFNVNIECAVRELQEIGYQFKPSYVDNLSKSEAVRTEQSNKMKEEIWEAVEYKEWQDENFFYIFGHTSDGEPYGITWEEMRFSWKDDET